MVSLILSRINYGVLQPNNISPGSECVYDDQFSSYDHPWSLETSAFNYAFDDYEAIFGSFEKFISLTPKQIKQIVSGWKKGSEKRAELLKEKGHSPSKGNLEKELDNLLGKGGR